MNEQALIEFDSHIAGKNARVRLYPDRIEWKQGGWMSTGAKAALGVATVGMSLLATGARGRKDEDMILIRSITSVSNKKSGLTKTLVIVNTAAGSVEFRCSGGEAERFKSLLLLQMGNAGQAQVQPVPQPQWAPPSPRSSSSDDVMARLKQLGELKEAGILSEDEFQAKKADILGRM